MFCNIGVSVSLHLSSAKDLDSNARPSCGITFLDRWGIILSASDEFFNLFGLERDEKIINRPLGCLLADKKDATQLLSHVLPRSEWCGMLNVRRHDGATSQLLGTAALCPQIGNSDARIALSVTKMKMLHPRPDTDKTDKHVDSEFLQQILDGIPDAAFVMDINGVIRFVNASAAELHRATKESLIGQNIAQLDDPETARKVRERIDKCLAEQRCVFETKHVLSNGELIPIQVYAARFEYKGETLILGIDRDMRVQRAAEKLIKASKERPRLALKSTMQGLYDLNVQTGDCHVSDAYATMLGYEPSEFVESNSKWIERLHPDDREPVAAIYKDYIAGQIKDYRIEFRQKTKNGDWKWILSIGKLIKRDQYGQPLRMIGTHTDITEMKLAQEELTKRMNKQQRAERLSLANGLAEAVAHELNQPLCAVMNYVAAINRTLAPRTDIPDIVREDARLSLKAAEHASRIIRQYRWLFSSKNFKMTPCCWPSLIEKSLELIRSELIEHHIRVLKDYELETPQVEADSTLIQQVILNLIHNAIEAMSEKGQEDRILSVRLSVDANNGTSTMHIGDTGPGFPQAIVHDIFDARRSTKAGGLGLGLSICQSIVRAHNGKMEIESTGPQGTLIAVTLPLARHQGEEID